jgi:hypothetical protein
VNPGRKYGSLIVAVQRRNWRKAVNSTSESELREARHQTEGILADVGKKLAPMKYRSPEITELTAASAADTRVRPESAERTGPPGKGPGWVRRPEHRPALDHGFAFRAFVTNVMMLFLNHTPRRAAPTCCWFGSGKDLA